VFTERTSVGLDVHARSVAAAGLDTVTGEVWERQLRPDTRAVLSWLTQLPGTVAVTYEAGPTGFGLARDLTAAGFRCEVAAPSKIRRGTRGSGEDRQPGRVALGPAAADG
jgi:transposase